MSLNEVCRACLCSGQTMSSLLESIVPKFEDTPPNSIVEMRKIFTKMLITTENSFPDQICSECLDEIQRTYFFMLKCKRSEDILMEMKNGEKRLKRSETVYGNDNENTDRVQFPANIHVNVADQTDLASQHTFVVKHEEVHSGIAVSNHLNRVNDVIEIEILAAQYIKQEPELDICTESNEFDEILFEDQSNTEIIGCPGCRFECKMMESLEKHIIDNHMAEKICKLCNQEFECSTVEHCSKHLSKSKNPKQSLRYEEFHTAEQLFKCDNCPKAFRTKGNLKVHKRNHTGERPFKCEICSKTYTRSTLLIAHSRSHTGERPFKCENCSKTYTRRSYLLDHLRSHTGERPYKCESCSKTFQRRASLADHLRQHTGERRFKCEMCSKTYTRNKYLVDHLKCHTPERKFKCEICPKAFKRKRNLIIHISCHQGE